MIHEIMDKAARLDALRPRHRVFVEHYLAGNFNGKAAAIAAGYKPSAAHIAARYLLRKSKIAEVVQEELAARGINPHRALLRLAELCFGMDLGDFSEFLSGTKTLAQLKTAGVKTLFVKRAKVKPLKDGGEERELELIDMTPFFLRLCDALGIRAAKDGEGRPTSIFVQQNITQTNLMDAQQTTRQIVENVQRLIDDGFVQKGVTMKTPPIQESKKENP